MNIRPAWQIVNVRLSALRLCQAAAAAGQHRKRSNRQIAAHGPRANTGHASVPLGGVAVGPRVYRFPADLMREKTITCEGKGRDVFA